MLRQIVLAAALAGTYSLTASYAKADDLDVVRHTVSGESTETGDHGWGRFCDIKNRIPFYTCLPDGYINGAGEHRLAITAETRISPKPTKPPCDHPGDGGDGGGDTGGDNGGGDGGDPSGPAMRHS